MPYCSGYIVKVIVHAANAHDTKGGCDVLKSAVEKYPTFEAFSGDAPGIAAWLLNFPKK